MNIYLIRHAESVSNAVKGAESRIGGRSNHLDLSPKGYEQINALSHFFASNQIIFDKAISSIAVRAHKTAHGSLRNSQQGLETIELDDRIVELSQGDYEGQLRSEIYTAERTALINSHGLDFVPPNGESMNMVGERMKLWLDEISTANYKNVAVFTHGIAMRCLFMKIFGWNHQRTREFVIGNTDVYQLNKQSRWQAKRIYTTLNEETVITLNNV